jgi:carboxymethylenebutenolidase
VTHSLFEICPAGHGFNCDERASYHEPSAALARRRTLDFLSAIM